MGTVVGAIAGGRVPVGNAAGDSVTSWLNPLSIVIGFLFVSTSAYLAAMFLVNESRRNRVPDLERYFAARALAAAIVAGALAFVGLIVMRNKAPFVYDGLTGDALPLVIVSLVCGAAVLVLLHRNARRGARPLAVGAVAAMIWAWGIAQHPYLLPHQLTIAGGGRPERDPHERPDRLRGRGRPRDTRDRAALRPRATPPRRGDIKARKQQVDNDGVTRNTAASGVRRPEPGFESRWGHRRVQIRFRATRAAPRGLEGSGADQTRARVKVTCVTPLGEEVAST